jgi:hypothetical protein
VLDKLAHEGDEMLSSSDVSRDSLVKNIRAQRIAPEARVGCRRIEQSLVNKATNQIAVLRLKPLAIGCLDPRYLRRKATEGSRGLL